MADQLWTARDVARFLQASVSWVYHASASGNLPYVKVGGLLRFHPEEIRALVGPGEVPPAGLLTPRP
jgi:excisionase family DNA binding protein